jgi:hypothetical protein
MKKLSRERIALLFFAVLVVFGLSALIFYITGLGHSLNVAASTIDDATGDLDDYTAILYEGTAEKRKALNEAGLDSLAQEGVNTTLVLGKDQAIETSENGDEVVASDVIPRSSGDAQSSEEEQSVAVSVAKVRSSFLQKNASVYELDLSDPTAYIKRTIVKAGKYRFGILAIDEASALPRYISKRIEEYEAADVDFIIAVVDDLSRVSDYEGIDIVISTQEEGLKPVGVSSDGVFFNDAALVGEVGTLLISPSKVISAKDISEL